MIVYDSSIATASGNFPSISHCLLSIAQTPFPGCERQNNSYMCQNNPARGGVKRYMGDSTVHFHSDSHSPALCPLCVKHMATHISSCDASRNFDHDFHYMLQSVPKKEENEDLNYENFCSFSNPVPQRTNESNWNEFVKTGE